MSKKYWFILIILIIALIALWYFALPVKKFSQNLPAQINSISQSAPVAQLKTDASDILTPPPLRSQEQSPQASLTDAGVLYQTNLNRTQNGNLPALKENAKLDQSAELKLQDMFKKQYFEHVSPSGVGPSDLAKEVGYDYIIIGENLALGNFKDDQSLLNAWMNSPGHRANILNVKYQDIGVAVGRGVFEGQQTWLAVQEFGKPASSCPSVDSTLKSQIVSLQNDATQTLVQLNSLKQQMDSSNPQTQDQYNAYNELVAEYNNLVHIYDNKVDELQIATSQYNSEVNAYNACLGN